MSGKNTQLAVVQALRSLEQKASGGDVQAQAQLAKAKELVGKLHERNERRMNEQRRRQQTMLGLASLVARAQEPQFEAHINMAGDVEDMDLAQELHRVRPFADDLEHKSELRKAKQEVLAGDAPFVRFQPRSWVRANVGNTVTADSDPSGSGILCATGARSGRPLEVARWNGDDVESGPITIAACPKTQINQAQSAVLNIGGGAGALLVARPYLLVEFGTRGYSVTAEVDIGTGTQFTVPASAVMLRVAMENLMPFQGGAPLAAAATQSLQLAGMLSPFPTQKHAPITRTGYLEAIAATDTGGVLVPPFAKRFFVLRQPESVPISILCLVPANNALGLAAVYTHDLAGGAFMASPFDLPPDTTAIGVSNTNAGGGAALTACRVIFELEF